MDFYIDVAVTLLLRALEDKKNWTKFGAALAKVFVRLERVIEQSPTLRAQVEIQRAK